MRSPRWIARSSKLNMLGRCKQNSKIISAVHTPIPFKETNARIASLSDNWEISCKANSPVFTFSAKFLIYSALRNVIPKDCNVSISVVEMLSAFTSPNCAFILAHIVACAFVDICWPIM